MENLGSATSGRFFDSADSKLYRSPSYFGVFLGLPWRRKRDERASFAVARNDSFSTNAYSCPQKNISLTKPSTFFCFKRPKTTVHYDLWRTFHKIQKPFVGLGENKRFWKEYAKRAVWPFDFSSTPHLPTLCPVWVHAIPQTNLKSSPKFLLVEISFWICVSIQLIVWP